MIAALFYIVSNQIKVKMPMHAFQYALKTISINKEGVVKR